MKKSTSASASVIACLIMALVSFEAMSQVPQTQRANDITYITGGIGEDEYKGIEAESKNWPLTLQFVQLDVRGKGEWISELGVLLLNSNKVEILKAVSDGPIMLVDLKSGKLSIAEYNLIKDHVQAGYDLLKNVIFLWSISQSILEHHERLDGSGYPNQLKAEQISIEGRIMAVADVVDAMSAYRPYRPSLGIDVALAEIERGRGSLYDESVADACHALFREQKYMKCTLQSS